MYSKTELDCTPVTGPIHLAKTQLYPECYLVERTQKNNRVFHQRLLQSTTYI